MHPIASFGHAMFGVACQFDCCFVTIATLGLAWFCQSHVGDCCLCSSGLVCGLRTCGMMEGRCGRGFPSQVSAQGPLEPG
eukprot:3220565-Amphidinium_carterae.1